MNIDGFRLGIGKTFIIAEVGKNHNGDIHIAKSLIETAYAAGCNAVKFQAYDVETLLHSAFIAETGTEPNNAWLEKCSLSNAQLKELKRLCDTLGITFLCTPESLDRATALYDMGVAAFKISSLNIDNVPLLEKIANYRLPVILSTGMSTIDEVERALDWLYPSEAAVLHCVSQYPALLGSVNLRSMEYIKSKFGCHVGFSDHTEGAIASQVAVAAGAELIEFHITLSTKLNGPDHCFSVQSDKLKPLVENIRKIEVMLGERAKIQHYSEVEDGYMYAKRRCLVAARDIPKGKIIESVDLTTLCPGRVDVLGASYWYKLIGKFKAAHLIKKGQPIYGASVEKAI